MLVRLLLAMVMGRDLNSGGERSRSLVVRVALLGIGVLKVLLGVGRLLRLMLVRILCVVCPWLPRVRVASRTAWSSFAFAALDFVNQCEPVFMCTPAMRDASVIDEPAAMAAKKRALSSGGTRRLVPMRVTIFSLAL